MAVPVIVVVVVVIVDVEAGHSHVGGASERLLGNGRRNGFNYRLVRTCPAAAAALGPPNHNLFPFLARMNAAGCL